MQNNYEGYSKPIQKELNAIQERKEINDIVNASFTNNEKNVFNTMLICICGAFVLVPAILLSI